MKNTQINGNLHDWVHFYRKLLPTDIIYVIYSISRMQGDLHLNLEENCKTQGTYEDF